MKILFPWTFLLLLTVTPLWAAGRQPVPEEPRDPEPVLYQDPDAVHREPAGFSEGPTPNAPVYLAELEGLDQFGLFANGGWDGNWYVGYNTCWVSKLPPAPRGNFERAFIGAKVGRMKTEPIPGRPSWEKRPIRGELNIAVASEPVWPQSRRFLLTETRFIPLEGDKENAVDGVGESRWFWVEVPLRFISTQKENYLALFSPSRKLSSAAYSPILAAGLGGSEKNTWLNSAVQGEPPFPAREALKTAVSYFEPAIAIKLVPPNSHKVDISWVHDSREPLVLDDQLTLSVMVGGTNIQNAWIEFSTDTRVWRQAVRRTWTPPYSFTLKSEFLPRGEVLIRALAVDEFENLGKTKTIPLRVASRRRKMGKK